MPFRFTLAQVLRVRESMERREELALQKAEMEVAQMRHRIDALTADLARMSETREAILQQAVRAVELQSIDTGMKAIVEARQGLNVALQTLIQKRDAQLKVYQAAHNARQMLDDLSVQQRNEYEQEQTRSLQKRLDDLFGARMQRN